MNKWINLPFYQLFNRKTVAVRLLFESWLRNWSISWPAIYYASWRERSLHKNASQAHRRTPAVHNGVLEFVNLYLNVWWVRAELKNFQLGSARNLFPLSSKIVQIGIFHHSFFSFFFLLVFFSLYFCFFLWQKPFPL